MRAYVEETNRANHERRASTAGWQTELTRLRKGLKQMLQVIEDGGYTRGMVERMREMEAREDELVALLAAQPQDVPDIHPNVAAIFKHKLKRLAETLNHPEDRQEASEAIRALIEKIVLHPGKGRGEMHATLHGQLGNLLDFAASRDQRAKNTNTPGARASGVSVSGIAGGGRNRRPRRTLEVEADIARVAAIWETAENHPGGPWLFGYFTAADIMFAPVASRFQTYGVSLEGRAGRYLERMLSHPLVQAWFASGQDEPETIDMFELPTSG